MRLFIQVVVSCLIVVGVLWFMWRLPRRSESLYPYAPILSLGSVWMGLLAVVGSALLWWVGFPDQLLVVVMLILDPGSISAGVLVLWIYRGAHSMDSQSQDTNRQHRQQACVGIVMGLIAVVLGYVYVMTHKRLFTPVGW